MPVRPERELVLRISILKRLPEPGPLPDLAIEGKERTAGHIKAVVYNFSAAPASQVTVRAVNRLGQTVSEKVIREIKSAGDFIPGEIEVVFPINIELSEIYRIIVDPENKIKEIFEGNNGYGINND